MALSVEINAETGILDYQTGEITNGSFSETPIAEMSRHTDDNGVTVEWNIRYAWIAEMSIDADYKPVAWTIPPFSSLNLKGLPGLPNISFYKSSFDISDKCDNFKITILETEYKDFHYNLEANEPIEPHDNGEPNTYVAIDPYEGFLPAEAVKGYKYVYRTPYYNDNDGREIKFGVDVFTFPIQYNYEEETVRAYTRIKYRIDFLEKEDPETETNE